MSITGKLTKSGATFTGFIADLGFDEDVTLRSNPRKTSEKSPDYLIVAGSPKGREIECGAAWEGESKDAGNFYLSLSVSFHGQTVKCNAVQIKDSGPDNLTILPFSER